MRRTGFWMAVGAFAVGALIGPPAQSQQAKAKVAPKLEPVAETKLLMEGLADPNLKGVEKLLKDRPKDAAAWTYARGQALILAETGNLLLIRPPKNQGGAEETWMTGATELRTAAAKLARAAADQDFVASRAALAGVANACNHCHKNFRVQTRVNPFPDAEK